MILARNLIELRSIPAASRGAWCVLVPTMGALHDGHAALIRAGAAMARDNGIPGGCVVSIFVNPTQFDDPADFARYPKTPDADAALCRAAGASAVWMPSVSEIYPPGAPIAAPPLPRVATAPGLEDASRPGHFQGVCQVVNRLFELTRPRAALFGEKDWQQYRVIAAMLESQRSPIALSAIPTVREKDGLALSSRNRFLSPADRPAALALSRALAESCKGRTPDEGEGMMRTVLQAAGVRPEYAVVRDAATLERPGPFIAGTGDVKWRALVAAKVGSVRLIDNAPWTPVAG